MLLQTNFLQFSVFSTRVYFFLAIGVFIFIAFRALSFLFPIININKEYRRRIKKYIPSIELISWILFMVWGIQLFHQENMLYSFSLLIILTLIIVFIVWYAIKDFVAGILFLTNNSFNLNETIHYKEYTGKIIQFKNRSMVVETDHGETIYIPYSLIISEIITKADPSEMILNHRFKMLLPRHDNLLEQNHQIMQHIVHLPWISIKKDPQIKQLSETNQGIFVEITVYAIEKKFFNVIEHHVRQKFEIAAINQ